jgi:hypothetical protein
VRLVLAAEPNGPLKIRYGLDHSGPVIDQKILDSSGGQLRDSSDDSWSNEGLDYPLWNWSVIFEKELE